MSANDDVNAIVIIDDDDDDDDDVVVLAVVPPPAANNHHDDENNDDDDDNDDDSSGKRNNSKRRKVMDIGGGGCDDDGDDDMKQPAIYSNPGSSLDDDSLSVVLTKFSNVLDLHKWKSVSKGFNQLCTKAIEGKCPNDKKKKLEPNVRKGSELRLVWEMWCHNRYDPTWYNAYYYYIYNGGEMKRRMDAEMIATKYGWKKKQWNLDVCTRSILSMMASNKVWSS